MRISPDLKPLIDAARKNGYTVVPDGKAKHYKVIYGKAHGAKAGQKVIDEAGPLIVSSTPSEFRDRDQTAMRWKRAGVIEEKQIPWRNEKPGGGGGKNRLTDPEVVEAKLAAIKAKSAENNEKTGQLRARLEPIIVQLGGWKDHWRQQHGVMATEVGRVAYHFMKSRGRVELARDATEAMAESSAQTLRKPGSNLGDKWLPFWTIFLDELERDGRPKERYMELYREYKGIPAKVETPAVGEPSDHRTHGGRWRTTAVDPSPAKPEESPIPDIGPASLPTLALRAVAIMARSPGATLAEVQEIGEKILQMELERR